MKVALYVRVSTQEQAENGYSINEQIERLQKYAEAMRWTVYSVYPDPGYSGAYIDRPALNQMIEDIRARKIDKVLVYKLDRLSRSQLDTLYLIEKVFLSNGVDFVSITESFDTDTPFGKAMLGILSVFAELERNTIKQRMIMGKDARAKDGKWRGGSHCPIGYDFVNGDLVVNEYEKMQILEAVDLFLKGYPTNKIEKLFRDKGYAHKYGEWTYKRIGLIFDNKLYCGYISNKGVWYKGTHEPIIDEDTFKKVNDIYLAKKQKHIRTHSINKGKTATLLGGLLICKRCGARYGTIFNNGYRYYICHSRRKQNWAMVKNPNCKNKTYPTKELDSLVLSEIRKLNLDAKSLNVRASDNSADKMAMLADEIAKIDRQRLRLVDLYGSNLYSFDELDSKIKALNSQKERLENEIRAIKQPTPAMPLESARALISSLSDLIDRGNTEEIKTVVKALIDHIEIDGEDIFIHWNFL